ncbi:MAG TPA: hypothetical protein VGX25_02425 [Actinophytocola sp.]|uniref:aspartate/ornithine carbamoyltransferase family protein n=1 Tax=Actinophytocola sp. TaxID=1872138 RepID=UPI002DDCB50B|nr:hypothetical protein [Actinophytocola sp.]HEV2778234.1 hypothetical protein [Actinophytocola sp.]
MSRSLETGRLVPDPAPLALRDEQVKSLDRLERASIVSALDISRSELLDLFQVAASLQTNVLRAGAALTGKILLTVFFEPSTRTRLSFESAAHRLGGSVVSVPDAHFTGVHKGESLADTGVMFSSYADVVVLRHSSERSVEEIRAGLDVPLINGGNGCDEHPTQAMADWYALLKWRNELGAANPRPDRRISLAMLGTPRLMRSMRSFLLLGTACFPHAVGDLTIVSDALEPLDAGLVAAIERAGWPYRCTPLFAEHVSDFDVIYQNALVPVGQRYEVVGSTVRVDRTTPMKPDTVILHPLARHDELSPSLDDTPHNLYFDQANGAVFVRQALLLALTGRLRGVLRGASRLEDAPDTRKAG